MRSVNVEIETIIVVVNVVAYVVVGVVGVIGIGVGARKFFASEISFQAAISGYATIPAFTLLEIFI